MKRVIIELIWLVGILTITTIIYFLESSNSAADINMHDTYIIGNGQISHPSFTSNFLSILIAVSFLIYLARVSYNGFKETTVNLILMLSAAIAIFYFSTNVILYLTASSPGSVWFNYSKGLILTYYFIKVLLIVVLAFTGFMTGKNFRNQSSEVTTVK